MELPAFVLWDDPIHILLFVFCRLFRKKNCRQLLCVYTIWKSIGMFCDTTQWRSQPTGNRCSSFTQKKNSDQFYHVLCLSVEQMSFFCKATTSQRCAAVLLLPRPSSTTCKPAKQMCSGVACEIDRWSWGQGKNGAFRYEPSM